MRLEGSGTSKLAQAVRIVGRNDYDKFEIATITSVSPTIIKLDHSNLVLDGPWLIVAWHLTERTQTVTYEDGTSEVLTFHTPLSVGDRVIVSSANDDQTIIILDKMVAI